MGKLEESMDSYCNSFIQKLQDLKRNNSNNFNKNFTLASGILLTGTTGYLGSYFLYDLLNSERFHNHQPIFCLIRSPDIKTAKHRQQQTFSKYNLQWNEELIKSRQVKFLSADLSKPQFGLSNIEYKEIHSRVGTIIHSASEVNLFKSFDELKLQNVHGTYEILKLAAISSGVKEIHYISTLGVFNSMPKQAKVFREDDLGDLNDLTHGYSQTKWLAEKLVRRFGEMTDNSCSVRIYRPGAIGCHTKLDMVNMTDLICGIFQASKLTRTYPKLQFEFIYGSIDFTVESILDIISIRTDENIFGLKNVETFHAFEYKFDFETEIVPLLDAEGLEPVSFEEWRDSLFAMEEMEDVYKNPNIFKLIYLLLSLEEDAAKELFGAPKNNNHQSPCSVTYDNLNFRNIYSKTGRSKNKSTIFSKGSKLKEIKRYFKLAIAMN